MLALSAFGTLFSCTLYPLHHYIMVASMKCCTTPMCEKHAILHKQQIQAHGKYLREVSAIYFLAFAIFLCWTFLILVDVLLVFEITL